MAISGTFNADFDAFYDACRKATVELKGFEDSASKVEIQLNRMVDSFSGRKIVSDATLAAEAVERIGGVTRLTTAEQERLAGTVQEALAKYKAMGVEAPDAITKINRELNEQRGIVGQLTNSFGAMGTAVGTFVGNFALDTLYAAGRAIWDLAKGSLDFAEQITNLSAKTGLSVEALQRMESVAHRTGSSLDSFTGAAYQLGIRIAGGGDSVKEALDKLGIAFDDIRRQKPEDQFRIATDALGRMQDETERNRLGQELFGRTFGEIAVSVANGYSKMAEEASVASDAQIAAANATKEAIDATWAAITGTVREGVGNIAIGLQALADMNWGEKMHSMVNPSFMRAAMQEWIDKTNAQRDVMLTAEPVIEDYRAKLAALTKEVEGVTAAKRADIIAGNEYGASAKEIADNVHLSVEAVERIIQSHKTAQQELKKTTEVQKIMNDLMGADAVKRANDLQIALAQLGAKGVVPLKSQWDEIVTTLRAAREALLATGTATVETTAKIAKLNQLITTYSGYGPTSGGNLPSGNLDVEDWMNLPGMLPGNQNVTPGARAGAVENWIQGATRDLEDLDRMVEGYAATQGRAFDEAVSGAGRMSSAFQLTQQQIEALSHAWGAMAGTGGSMSDWDFRGRARAELEELAQRLRISASMTGAGGQLAAMQLRAVEEELARPTFRPAAAGNTININASNSFYDTPDSLQRLADKVSSAVLSRLGR